MTQLALAAIAFNAPRAISEQIRLLDKYLRDDYELHIFDQSSDEDASAQIRDEALAGEAIYTRLETRMHHEGLNHAARTFLHERMIPPGTDAPFIGFLDHDVYPIRETRLVPRIEAAGFYGVGQRHAPTGHLYPWPGFVFFSREWIGDRELDFGGIRAPDPRRNGDTGSAMWPLFDEEDWRKLFTGTHGYRALREPDAYGLQSWGYEQLADDWIHVSNASHWMLVPEPEERDRLVYEMLAAL